MLRSVLIKDHMSKNLVTLSPDTGILQAIDELVSNETAGAPVLDAHGRLVGILTDRDCMKAAMHGSYHGTPGEGLVEDYMSADPQWVSPDKSILTLAEMFINSKFHRYPVVDNGRLVGVISRRDVMRALSKYYPV